MSATVPRGADWEEKRATLTLSKARRAALREFASGFDPTMTKAEALYELIDTALPLAARPASPAEAASHDLAERCEEALRRVAETLPLVQALLSRRSGPSAPALPPSFEKALAPREWVAGALEKLGRASPSAIELDLAWEAAQASGGGAALVFSVRGLAIDGRALAIAIKSGALPNLTIALAAAPTDRSPDISLPRLTEGARLRCAQSSGGWRCELLSRDGDGAPWLRLDWTMDSKAPAIPASPSGTATEKSSSG